MNEGNNIYIGVEGENKNFPKPHSMNFMAFFFLLVELDTHKKTKLRFGN